MDQQQQKRSRIETLYLFSTTKVPSAYICPVSWRIMSDPVLDPGDPEGRALEREAFEAHQRQYGVRPLTGLPAIPPSNVRTLVTLQKSICHFIADEQDTSQQQPPAKRARLNEQHMPCPVPAVPVPVGTGQGSAGAAGRPVLNLAAESEVPAPFFCPVSRCLMVDPVISRRDQGASLERAAAEEHMALYGTNPLTGEPMSASDLIPDNIVRTVINRWLAKHSGPQLILQTRPAAAGDEDGGADADAAAAAGLGAAAPAAAAPLSLLPAPPPAAAAATAAVAKAPSAAAAAGSLPSNSPRQQLLPPHQPQQEQQQQPMQHGHRPPVPPGREPSNGGAGLAGVTAAPPGSEVATVNANASAGTASLEARAGPGGPTLSGEPPSSAHAPGSVSPRRARKMARQMRTPPFPRSTGLGHPTSVVPEQPRVAAGAGPGPSQAQAPGSQARVPIKIEADEADQAAQRLVGSHANGGGGPPPPPQDERMEEEAVAAGGGTGGSGSDDDGTAASADGGPPRSEVMDLVSSDTSAAETGDGAAGGGGGSGHTGSGALVAAGACTSAGAAAAPAAGTGGVAMGPGPRQGRVRRTARWCLTAPVPLAARGAAAPGIGTRAPAGTAPAGPETGGAAPGAAAVAPFHAGAAGAGASASGSGDAAFEDEDGGGAAADEADGEDARAAADALEEAGPTIGRVRTYYTNEELEALVAGVEAYGNNRWTEIKATNPQLSKRTESALLQKWTMLLKAASTRWIRGCTDLPPQLRARISAMLSNEAKDSGAAAAGAGAGDAGGRTPQGDAGPEQQQQHAVARGGSAGKVVRYTEQEMEAMLDGILKHGCRWKVIMQQNAAVLGGRNELSLKAKWDSLRAWAAEGWPARKQEPPSERIRGKVAAVLAMMNQQQVASSPRRPYVYRKGFPLEVSREAVEAMVRASGRRDTVTVQVRLDGVTLPGVHSALIRTFASRGRHLLSNCASLRDALDGKQVVAWRRSSTEEDGFLLEAVSGGGPPMAERDAAADGPGESDDVDDDRDNGGKGGEDALSDDDEGDEEEGGGELGGVCDGDGGDEDDNGRGNGAAGGDGEQEGSGSEHGSG